MSDMFCIGTTVKLASGGPVMTVIRHCQGGVLCTWFLLSGRIKEKVFPMESVELFSTNAIKK